MLMMPITASAANQTSMMGANQRLMPAVPRDCTAYSATSTTMVSGTT